jgi:alkyl hydroperoxide reductase subunit D
MSLDKVKENLGDFAKDTKLNLSSLFVQEHYHEMSKQQVWGSVLAGAYFLGDKAFVAALLADNKKESILDKSYLEATKTAASLMAMTNVYYRFLHLVEDGDFAKMPAGLRMNAMKNHGINEIDFEIFCLVISAVNGCGLCIKSHVKSVLAKGASKKLVQGSIKIASVVHATFVSSRISSM